MDPVLDDGEVALDVLALANAVPGSRLAAVVEPQRWVEESERREEAARTFLLWNGQLPAREDERNARALLSRLDSAARAEALERARRDREHRSEIRRRLEDARAREAASRYSPE